MASLFERVDALFADWNTPTSPGCALAIVRDGAIIYARGYGMADLEREVPLTPTSVFDIASTSKQFFAACVTLLAQAGSLSLDDDIHTYLPELPDYGHGITIRHLIHHTSGLRDYLTLMLLAGMRFENVYPAAELIALIARQQELNFVPGERYLYSNTGYVLLAEIVRRVSGKSAREYAQAAIFDPLGMTQTHIHDDYAMLVKQRAIGYGVGENGGFRLDMSQMDIVGDGSVYTTVEDLARWDQNFYDHRVGGERFVAQLLTRGVLNDGTRLDYAFGLMHGRYNGLPTVSHGGSWAGYRTELIRFPEQQFSVICLANLATIGPSKLTKRVADLCLAEEMAQVGYVPGTTPEVHMEPTELAIWPGVYFDDASAGVIEIVQEEERLAARVAGMAFPLAAIGPARFRPLDLPYDIELRFTGEPGQDEVHLQFIVEAESPDTFRRITPPAIDPETLANYQGTFHSEEIPATFIIGERDGALSATIGLLPPATLQPALSDLLYGPMVALRFERGSDGLVTGLRVQAGRAGGIFFAKQPS